MSNRVLYVAANHNGDVWCIDNSERIWVSSPPKANAPRTWSTPTNGFAVKIAINNHYALCINRSNQLFWIPLNGTTWQLWAEAPPAIDMAVGTDTDDFTLVDTLGRIWRWDFDQTLKVYKWVEPDPRGVAVHAAMRSRDHLYCVNRVREVFYLDAVTNLWQRAPEHLAQDIDFIPQAASRRDHWLIDENGYFWRYTQAAGRENPAVGGRAVQMAAVNKDHVWAVNNSGQLWEWVAGRSPAWVEHCIPFPGFYYTVVWGDALSKIAQRFGKSLQAILDANPQILNPDLIFPGQKILIPG